MPVQPNDHKRRPRTQARKWYALESYSCDIRRDAKASTPPPRCRSDHLPQHERALGAQLAVRARLR
eukprot:3445876-Alexandrium_andersonii.AAC.1